ncbi:hypothetical protein O2W15_00760 [Modestobacter sp. VKM Ac-2979]|uniref:hypothetical protein n=1 Tax=unclassified Modestobacter TaxID=2643866 RepID=UPI0022ABB5DA|nr:MULTISPECIES: hypothetical protein [unclassified Modestobacter]MCZ2809955.1 hypothetical protein [Modestobacter sp. VKM Ac-2979]MCZ2842630.1 hypothetical protein [Modestobacter sp. VKM Ac-2980]
MLILTPTPLQTAAERAFFAELAGWDTGSGVRGAVMAALPVVEGPMQRRQSDAVLFVPEGVAVVRVVEVERQSGVVTASPEGAWTIGPGDGPGEVLQLAGGGSNPLDGLMRSGMHAAVTLRQAGLEPGRIARLTVLTGSVTGLLPADGDLGEGDQVALLDSGSLQLGVARAARHAGTDNPRLWTTADVRAGIEALGMAGRIPTVEELNGEGFPYSPYVLRRPDLLTPAALNAAPRRTTVAAPTSAPADGARRSSGEAGPLVDPAAAARIAAAAVEAQEAAERRDVAPQSAAAPPAEEAPSDRRPPGRPGDTMALVHEPAAPSADDTGGLGGLFGAAGASAPVAEPTPPRLRELPPELRPRPQVRSVGPAGGSTATARGDSSRGRQVALVLAALAVVALLVVVGVLALSDDDGDARATTAGATAGSAPATSAAPGPVVGATAVVNGTTFTLRVVEENSTCIGHSYDAVAGFFANNDCTDLDRALWSAEVEGLPAVVSVARVTMPDPASAQALRSLADTDGSGNVSDLLREGASYEGAPQGLSGAQYASSQQGATVSIVETSWAGAERGATSALDALASAGLSLPGDGVDAN